MSYVIFRQKERFNYPKNVEENLEIFAFKISEYQKTLVAFLF